jgi:hypothetical protein
LKKRTKKLLLLGAVGRAGASVTGSERSFFASPGGAPFFSKKEALAFLFAARIIAIP